MREYKVIQLDSREYEPRFFGAIIEDKLNDNTDYQLVRIDHIPPLTLIILVRKNAKTHQ